MAKQINPLEGTKWEEKEVFQSNPLIESKKNMNLTESRLFYLGLMELRPQLKKKEEAAAKNKGKDEKDDFHFEPLYFKAADVIKILGQNPNFYKKLHDITKKLSIKLIDRYVINKETGKPGWEHIPVFAKISWQTEDYRDGLMIKFNDEMKSYIYDLTGNGYTAVAGKSIFTLQSVYAIRLIELLLQYRGYAQTQGDITIIERKIAVEDLRRWLDISDNQYKLTAEFKRRVLDSSKKYIADTKTGYSLDYITQKAGRKIVAYIFTLTLPTDDSELNGIKEIAELKKKKEKNITPTVDNPDADIYDVLRRYDVGKIIARRLANKYDEKEIREKIRTAIAYRERHKVTNFPGLIYDLITGKYTVNVEQTSLFDEVEEKPKYTSAERKKIEKEQRAANKVRMEENKCRAPGEQVPLVDVPDIEEAPPAAALYPKPAPSTEPVKTPAEKDKLSVSIDTIKMFVDGGKADKVEKELDKLAKKGISIDDVRALSVEKLNALLAAADAAESAPAQEPEKLENIPDQEPPAAPEQNIFDEVKATPEEEAEANEQERILAQFLEEARAAAAQLNKKELLAIKDSVEKKIPEGKIVELRLQQLKINKYDVYYVVDEFLNE